MPPNPIDVKPANLVATLVTFSWGAGPTVVRYAAWSADITYAGSLYTALPALEVNYGRQDGSTRDIPAGLTMSEVSPLNQMRGTFPPVTVEILELRPGDDSTAAKMWKGIIGKVQYNLNGNSKTVKVEVKGHKDSLSASISLVLGKFCNWIFGKSPCMFNLAAATENGTITAISGQKVTVSGLTTLNTVDWWRWGEMKVDGFAISIHSHNLGTGEFQLVKPPPAYWVGQPVAVAPGCDGTVASCRIRGQEENFGAMGMKIPDRDVRMEP